jgi:MFS family permease
MSRSIHAFRSSQSAPPAEPPSRRPGRLDVLRHRNFALFWLASITSNSGTWMQLVAQGWLVYNLTNSTIYLGLVGFAKAVPVLLLPPFGGVVADRVPRLKLLKVTQTISLVLAAILGLLVSTHLVQVWQIILLSFLGGTVNAFDQPTQQALVPDLLSRDDLPSGIALNSVTWQGAALFGPSLAGVTVAMIGLAGAFYANAASYLAVVIALFLMRGVPERAANSRPRSVFGDLSDGLRYAGATRIVSAMLLLAVIANLFGRSYQQLLPVFARDILHVGAGGLGLLTAAPGLGALIGATFIAGTARNLERKGRVLLSGLIAFSVAVILLALSRNFALSLLALAFGGLAFILFSTMMTTIMQLTVPGQMRGRVMSLQMVAMQGPGQIGALLIGLAATFVGTPRAVGIGAALVAVAALAATAFVPEIRRYPGSAEPEVVDLPEAVERPA